MQTHTWHSDTRSREAAGCEKRMTDHRGDPWGSPMANCGRCVADMMMVLREIITQFNVQFEHIGVHKSIEEHRGARWSCDQYARCAIAEVKQR
jgi:hypothetical protein